MAKTHFIFDRSRAVYFRTCPGPVPYLPDARTRAEADLYDLQDAPAIAGQVYGPEWAKHLELIEATVTEHAQWRGRRGGSVCSPKKAKHSRRAWRLWVKRQKCE